MRRREHFRTVFIVFLLLTTAVRAQQHFDSWTTADGLPQNSVLSIAQTSDGYLWIGSFEGLARFDGVDFTIFNSINTPALKSNYVFALLEDRRGNFWIGTDGGGLLRRTGNEFFNYSTANGLLSNKIMCLLEARDGSIWIGSQSGGVNRLLPNGELRSYAKPQGLPDYNVSALAEDDDGAIWIGTDGGLVRFENEKLTVYTTKDGLADKWIRSLRSSPAKGLWIGTNRGLNFLKDNRIASAEQNGTAGLGILALTENADGDLFIGTTEKGLYRLAQNSAVVEKMQDETFNGELRAIYRDDNNELWFGVYPLGLFRLQKKRFRGFGAADGIPENSLWMTFEDAAGNLWFNDQNRKLHRRAKDGTVKAFEPAEILQTQIFTVVEDKDRNLWFGGNGGITKFDGNRFDLWLKNQTAAQENFVISLLFDDAGNVWSGTRGNGIYKYRDGQQTSYRKEQGLTDNRITGLFESGGAIWVGTENGLSRIKDEQIVSWKLGDGAASNWINAFYEDAGGALWIGTSGGGLYRYKNEKFTVITSRDGLYDDLAFTFIESGGNLWMSGNRGIYRADLQELNDFADGRRASVHSYSYDTSDGMPTRECNGGFPGGAKSPDGYLWFPTAKGLVRVEPRLFSDQPPQVLIERVRLGDEIQNNSELLTVAPGQENLEIKYTAISWQRPRQIKFKYRLVGLSDDWTEAGNRRTAYFPYLPSGDYTFQVVADNGEGVWNETGKSIRVKVLPPFYRSWWFFALGWIALGCLVLLIYKLRVSQLRKKQAQQEEFSRRLINVHETERRRIAAELHDSIGQSLAMIKNRAVLGAESATDENARQQLDLITTQTAQTISEVREISYNLRPYLLDNLGLTKAVKSLLNKVSETNQFRIKMDIDEVDGLFGADEEMSIYRIIQENLSNIIKHAAATEVTVMLKKGTRRLSMIIKDNGKGFDTGKTPTDGFGTGGFGLLGIAERVRMLGGVQEIETEIGAGTTVFIRIPLSETK